MSRSFRLADTVGLIRGAPIDCLARGLTSLLLAAAPFLAAAPLSAQAPSLGTASGFAVLGASTVTNAGASVITGDLGVAPGTAITGFPPGTVTGAVHAGDPTAVQAQSDLTVAYDALVASVCTTTLTGQDLGGMTLTPGVYCFAAAAQLTGTLTLDGLGSGASVFVFQTGSTLTTAAASAVTLTNGATANNVFWQIGSSATIGANTAFAGNLIALASITMSTGSTVSGRVLARTAAVTLTTSVVTAPVDSIASIGNLGAGCGTPVPVLAAVGMPVIGNSAFGMTATGLPFTALVLAFSTDPASIALAPGCTQFLGNASLGSFNVYVGDGAGVANIAIPVPNDVVLDGASVYWQTAECRVSGPLFGNIAIGNGLVTVLGMQ